MDLAEQIFNDAWNHMLCQKARSAAGDTNSALYGAKGHRDPVGLFINIEHYEPTLEGKSASDPLVIAAIERSIGKSLGDTCISLLVSLSAIHREVDPSEWQLSLRALALQVGVRAPKSPGPLTHVNQFFIRTAQERWGFRLGYGHPPDEWLA